MLGKQKTKNEKARTVLRLLAQPIMKKKRLYNI